MRWCVFFLFGIFLFSFVGASSEITTKIIIPGCNIRNTCSTGSFFGEYYCDESLNRLSTLELGLGCSMGNNILGGDICCPEFNVCVESEIGGEFKCETSSYNCEEMKNKINCGEVSGCAWINDECINARDASCGDYKTSEDCENDVFNLASVGTKLEICGTTESIVCDSKQFTVSSCGCSWVEDAVVGEQCQIKVRASESVVGSGKTAISFSCSSYYDLGECVNGEQTVEWTSFPSSSISSECASALGCKGGSEIKKCGEQIIKLPGFSLFSLLLSLCIITFVYFLKKE